VIVRRWLAGTAALAVAAFGALAVSNRAQDDLGERPPQNRPSLALLTSLPLVFGEQLSLDRSGSPALSRMEQRYKVQPIGVADAASLKGQQLLLMAHPRAQPAEALVELDQWVRSGGHVLLLADPKLDWPSERPLGDLLRPPPMFADTYADVQPVYEDLPGWKESTIGITDYDKLPGNARKYLERVQQLVKVPIDMISTGPDREETIVLKHSFG